MLDVGCNNGYWLKTCRSALPEDVQIRTVGTDVSVPAIEFCRKHDMGDDFYTDPIEDLSKRHLESGGKPFDVVVCGDVIEHAPLPRVFLDSMLSLVASDGVVLLKTPNFASLGRRLLGADKCYYADPHFTSSCFRDPSSPENSPMYATLT